MNVEFDGAIHQFPDDFTQDDIAKALSEYKPPSVAADVGRGAVSGLARGVTGLAGLPADLLDLGARGVDAVAGTKLHDNYTKTAADYAGGDAMQGYLENVTGKLPEAQTGLGKIVQTGAEFLPAMLGGPESIATKLATRVAAPALASEGAGALTKGTDLEPYARAGGALLGAAGATKLAQREAKIAPTTAAELETATKAGYNHPEVKALEIDSAKANDFVDRSINSLKQSRFSEKQAGQTYDALEQLRKAEFGANHTLQDFDSTRQLLNSIAKSPSTDGEAARRAVRSIDAYTARIPSADVVAGNPAAAANALFEGRKNAAANFRGERIDEKIQRASDNTAAAHSGANLGNTLRQQINSILKSPKQLRGFNEAERDAMRQFVKGSASQNVLRRISNLLGGGGGLGQLVAGGAGAAFGNAEGGPEGAGLGAVALPALGMLTRNRYNASILKQAQKLAELARNRSPIAQARIAALAPMQKSLTPSQIALITATLANGASPRALNALPNYQR